MSTRVAERVDEWPDEPFSDGYRQLHDLADDDFSGAVRAGGAELYMTKGTVVGVLGGDIEDFEGATGTVFESPSPALPLLAVMQERNDEVRAKYYTEKTAISEVDDTLSDGGFTGYVELSENVLSGDYYLVYHGGQSMSVAYVGNKPQLLDGQEAFDRADGEVGIYQVRPATIDQIEIPEPPAEPADDADEGPQPSATEPDDASSAGDESEVTDDGTAPDAPDSEDAEEPSERSSEEPDDREPASPTGRDEASTTDESVETAGATDQRSRETEDSRDRIDDGPDQTDETREQPDRSRETAESQRGSTSETTEGRDRSTADRSPGDDRSGRQSGRETSEDPATPSRRDQNRAGQPTQSQRRRQEASGTADQQPREEKRTEPTRSQKQKLSSQAAQPASDRTRQSAASGTSGTTTELETRAIPSLDPEQTKESDDGGARGDSPGRRETDRQEARPADHQQRAREPDRQQQSGEQSRRTDQQAREPERTEQSHERSTPQSDTGETATAEESTTDSAEAESVDEDVVETLEAEIEDRESEIERLESDLETVSGERDDLQEELESLRAERDELAEEVERLESELERLESEFGAATEAERRMTASEALEGTDLFVRYHSKGDATLEKAHGGSVRRDDVTENLRLEKHTQFDASSVAIGNLAYGEFLESTAEYQFVQWVIYDLLFEIRDTNYTKELGDLYDALPKIDRAELSGAVDVVYSDEGQETRTTERFDVVLRDRMGNPLLVANLNDSREAATESMMEDLITSAERVGQTSDGFSGAFLVTQSFFEPGALETASEATKGGLLSRDKRKSFVNLSRKRGYHLCLVEARNENHHLAVPEL